MRLREAGHRRLPAPPDRITGTTGRLVMEAMYRVEPRPPRLVAGRYLDRFGEISDLFPGLSGAEERQPVTGFDHRISMGDENACVSSDRDEDGTVRPWHVLDPLSGDG